MSRHAVFAVIALGVGLCFGLVCAAIATACLVVFGVGPDWSVALWAFAVGFVSGTFAGWNPR